MKAVLATNFSFIRPRDRRRADKIVKAANIDADNKMDTVKDKKGDTKSIVDFVSP